MTNYAIFGYYGQGNAGDEAILAAFIQGLLGDSPNHSICVYTDKAVETRKLRKVKAYKPVKLQPIRILKGLIRTGRIDYVKSLLQFLRTDIVIIGGGSLFFDSKESNKWMVEYLDLIKTSKQLNKKVALVGVSVGPLHLQQSRQLIAQTFAKVDLISVRDFLSRDLLVECGVGLDRINVIPDLVFTLRSANDERITEILKQEAFPLGRNKVIALTPCCYNQNHSGWHEQYINFCEHAVAKLDVNLWFIPMQRNDSFDDLRAIRSLIDRLTPPTKASTAVLTGIYEALEIQGILGKADFVFAERLHGAIMALNAGAPCIGINYMPKVAGVLELANLNDRVVSMDEFLSGSFLEKTLDKIKSDLNTQPIFDTCSIAARAAENFTKINNLKTANKINSNL